MNLEQLCKTVKACILSKAQLLSSSLQRGLINSMRVPRLLNTGMAEITVGEWVGPSADTFYKLKERCGTLLGAEAVEWPWWWVDLGS